MIWRRQLAVASPISIAAVGRAFFRSAIADPAIHERAESTIANRFHASSAVGTDSGTSALILALRATVPAGGVVGLPGYACVDLTAAALFAGVRVRLYDIDPQTLSPDLDSIAGLLRRGVDAIVVAHLFGFPSDVPAVRALASRDGVPVIEDAAQGAGGLLDGSRLGSLGDLSVLSFGRGKGLCAGGGGALLTFDARWAGGKSVSRPDRATRGWKGLIATTAQWALGRPRLYGFPSMLPWLHLGEMVYHPAHAPESLSVASATLIESAFGLEPADLAVRRRHSRILDAAAQDVDGLATAHLLPGAEPGYLRYPVRDVGGRREVCPELGVLRSYPRTLAEQPELAPILAPGEPPTRGAVELRQSVFTLPTHRFVTTGDLDGMRRWLRGASSI